MKPYEAAFEVGAEVLIMDDQLLEKFNREWKYHNPLTEDQLGFAGKIATVKQVGFYHGGDPLYVLEGVPGVWHEQCLHRKGES